MELTALTALSPVDGRYRRSCEPLAYFFSEKALISYRLKVEIEYFLALTQIPLKGLEDFPHEKASLLTGIAENLSVEEADEVKGIEKITNHDVKAVEYFLKKKFDENGLEKWREYIHFGLTSQDINNTSFPMMLKDASETVMLPAIEKIIAKLRELSEEWKDVAMLAKTHGQPASPTRLGKELDVFIYRLETQTAELKRVPISGKFGGATGNFNAHTAAFPGIDWHGFANRFLSERLGIEREEFTTQISNYDNLARYLDALRRVNTILIDLDRDIWMYISMNYFKQKIKAGEVGSSAMPHKVNPIDFENSEGNLGIANALLSHLSQKLPISRLQRDLTDSTVIRNLGVPFGHTLIALNSTAKGLDKLILNQEAIDRDLEDNQAVVAEGIQTILRRENYPNPYEKLKELTRTNQKITEKEITEFINTLEIDESVKEELRKLKPSTYTGSIIKG